MAAIQDHKGLLALAGLLEGMCWHPHWMVVGLAGMVWYHRVAAVIGFVGRCRRSLKTPGKPGGCILLDRRKVAQRQLLALLTPPEGCKGTTYLRIRLGTCTRGEGTEAVWVLWHQVLALACHGFPTSRDSALALHDPRVCSTQHGLCCCISHVCWGTARANKQHELVTRAVRAAFCKVPLASVAARAAALRVKDKASAAELVEEVASHLRGLSLAAAAGAGDDEPEPEPAPAPAPAPAPLQPMLTRRRLQQQLEARRGAAAGGAGQEATGSRSGSGAQQQQQVEVVQVGTAAAGAGLLCSLPALPARSTLPCKVAAKARAAAAREAKREAAAAAGAAADAAGAAAEAAAAAAAAAGAGQEAPAAAGTVPRSTRSSRS